MSAKLRESRRMLGEVAALLAIGALVSGLAWLWWWAIPRATGPADIIDGKVVSIGVDPNRYSSNRVVMLVKTGNIQVGLSDRTSGFMGCKVGSDIKMRRTESSTGFTSYKFVPGSCSR